MITGESALLRWKKRMQVKLRWFMIIILIIGGAMGAFVHSVRRQREAAAVIESIGGTVTYDAKIRPTRIVALAWFQEWVGDRVGMDYVSNIGGVALYSLPSDRVLGVVERLNGLKELHVSGPFITDSSLGRLSRLTGLRRLSMFDSKITDAGLAQLHGMTRLRVLSIRGAKISDAGLRHLRVLADLEILYLSETQVTPAGENELSRALPALRIAH